MRGGGGGPGGGEWGIKISTLMRGEPDQPSTNNMTYVYNYIDIAI